MRRIAVYGKGGIGKSTTVGNVSAALAGRGLKVIQIGCDPKADSTRAIAGRRIPTVLETMRDNPDPDLEDIVFEGDGGVLCVECGGPRPGVGCAGRGIIAAFEQLEDLDMIGVYKPDVILYDVLGDVVCGGFAMPIRNGYARDVFVVTSGEMMSLYAASNIAYAVNDLTRRQGRRGDGHQGRPQAAEGPRRAEVRGQGHHGGPGRAGIGDGRILQGAGRQAAGRVRGLLGRNEVRG